jgi:hypothetical protein
MGDRSQVLLVNRREALAGAAASLLLAGCSRTAEQRIDPRQHQAFFLWPGVASPAWLANAREVYLLAGEVRHGSNSRFHPLRTTPRVSGPKLWLVVRIERLDWADTVTREVLHTLALWAAAGNRLEGLQIDFDAATRGLAQYAAFLAKLRKRLPRPLKLSITGLLDWSAGGDPRALRQLSGTVDEIVVQTYQGRRTIPGYERYLATLPSMGIPYRIGLVAGGLWRAPPELARDPAFRGYVVFLLDRDALTRVTGPA